MRAKHVVFVVAALTLAACAGGSTGAESEAATDPTPTTQAPVTTEAVPTTTTEAPTPTVSSNSLTHEEFVRLNTTDLPAWHAVESATISPAVPDTGTTAVSNADRDAYFLYINTTALDGLASNGDEPPHRSSGPR